MCQLLGMNCNVPTDIVFSFAGFRERGGATDEHSDGWGIAFFEDAGCRLFLDYHPAAHSPIADLIASYHIKSENVLCHIRKATQGKVMLANTHPFKRELWGEYWCFAHNGDLKNLQQTISPNNGRFQAVGTTDSELAFCYILNQLSNHFVQKPDRLSLYHFLEETYAYLAQFGTFNCLLSNGEMLVSHCSTHLHYLTRRAPFKPAHLSDADLSVDFATQTTPNDVVSVIATQPLTDNEAWSAYQAGEIVVFEKGEISYRAVSKSHPAQ